LCVEVICITVFVYVHACTCCCLLGRLLCPMFAYSAILRACLLYGLYIYIYIYIYICVCVCVCVFVNKINFHPKNQHSQTSTQTHK